MSFQTCRPQSYWKGSANLHASKASSVWFLFSFNKTCNTRNKFCDVNSVSMFRSFPMAYITSTYTRVDLSCPHPSKNTTQESVGATADIMHLFDWHGPTLLMMRLQCDEDTTDAIRRELRIASVFHQTKTRLLSDGWWHWRIWQASRSQCFKKVNNRRRFTCTEDYVFKALLKQRKNVWSRKQISSFKNSSLITWSIIKLASMYEGSACNIATTTIAALFYVCSV